MIKATGCNDSRYSVRTFSFDEAYNVLVQYFKERMDVQISLGDRWIRLFSVVANDGIAFLMDGGEDANQLNEDVRAYVHSFGDPLYTDPNTFDMDIDGIRHHLLSFAVDNEWSILAATSLEDLLLSQIDSQWPTSMEPSVLRAKLPGIPADISSVDTDREADGIRVAS